MSIKKANLKPKINVQSLSYFELIWEKTIDYILELLFSYEKPME